MAAVSLPVLHYVYDPLCGWCYGAAPLLDAAQAIDGLAIVLHGGGMMSGANRQSVNDNLRRHVMAHDQRIAQATGQPFGQAYFDGLLRDTGAVFDSTPPTTAILAAQEIAGLGLAMLHLIQHAHYVLGQRVADAGVLAGLAQQLELDAGLFAGPSAAWPAPPPNSMSRTAAPCWHAWAGRAFPPWPSNMPMAAWCLSTWATGWAVPKRGAIICASSCPRKRRPARCAAAPLAALRAAPCSRRCCFPFPRYRLTVTCRPSTVPLNQ